jgi:putative MATE family efflux protein
MIRREETSADSRPASPAAAAPSPQPFPRGVENRLLQEENLSRAVWSLAWPAVLTMMLQFANGLVDLFFVGQLGPAAQAAVGMGGQVVMLLMAVAMAVTSGATAIVARYVGAGDRRSAVEAAKQALMLAALLSLAVGGPLWLLRRQALQLMGAAAPVVAAGEPYLAITTLAITPYFLLLTLIAIFQGCGDLRRPLAIMLLVNGGNILGDCFLIRGWGPLPGFGVAGAGIASSAARVGGALLAAAWLRRTELWQAGAEGWHPQRAWFARLLRIGNPAALQALLRNLGATSYIRVLAESAQGTAAVAALFVGLRAEGLGYMPGVAYGRAATALVGQNLGAGQPERAERSGWLCTWQALGFILALSAVFFVFADPIARVFSHDPAVIALAASYLRINAIGEPFLAFSIVLGGALQGAGDTRFQALASILTMWVLRLPATYWLCLRRGYGVEAAWWTMAVTTILQGLLLAAWFRRGRWKGMEV